jgi:hypothetical protein
VFALIAMVLFVLAAFGVSFDDVKIVELGLAFLALQVATGWFTIPVFWNRPQA